MSNTSLSVSTETLKFLFSGPRRFVSYIKKIKNNHKRKESILHLSSISFGFILGVIFSYTLLNDLPEWFQHRFNLESFEIIIELMFSISVGTVISSLCYGITKVGADFHNLYYYNVSNSQYRALDQKEIDMIIDNCKEELTLDKDGVVKLHNSIIECINSQVYKINKQMIKNAHWQFRKGNISLASKLNTVFCQEVTKVMIDCDKSRKFIKDRIDISYIRTHLLNNGKIDTFEECLKNVIESTEKNLSDLMLLKNLCQMGNQGVIDNDFSIGITTRSRNTSQNSIPEYILTIIPPSPPLKELSKSLNDNNNNNNNLNAVERDLEKGTFE